MKQYTTSDQCSTGGVPILSRRAIDDLAERILLDYDRSAGQAKALDIDHFCECYLGLELDYCHLSADGSILGAMVFEDGWLPVCNPQGGETGFQSVRAGTIVIDRRLNAVGSKARERFTLGHEAAHWLLHRGVVSSRRLPLRQSSPLAYISCRRWAQSTGRRPLAGPEDWMEWQADYMASSLLMPRTAFRRLVLTKLAAAGIRTAICRRPGDTAAALWLDYLTAQLADHFQVSVSAAGIRLRSLGLAF